MLDIRFTFLVLVFFTIFTFLDFLWLSFSYKRFYKIYLSNYLDIFRIAPAISFYAVFSLGITIFVLVPMVLIFRASYSTTFLIGSLFGFFNYSTYNLTNRATLSKWSSKVVFVDILYGSISSGLVSVITSYLYGSFFSI